MLRARSAGAGGAAAAAKLALTWGFGIGTFAPVELRNSGFLGCGAKQLGIFGDAAGVWRFLDAFRMKAV